MTVNVLLVEDNLGDAVLVTDMLLSAGRESFFVEHVGCLAEAERRLGKHLFDVVLLDLALPDSDGLDTVSRLLPFSTDCPIIVLTGLDDDRIGANAVHAGAQDYVIKGRINGDALGRAIRYAQERCKAQKAFEKLGRHHERILQALGEGVVEISSEGAITFVNPAAREILGWTKDEELAGRSGCEIVCPRAVKNGGCEECFRSGNEWHTSTESQMFLHRDGTSFPVESVCTAINEEGQFAGAVVVFRDVTEPRKREQELTHLRQLYEMILDSAGEGIYGVDTLGRATFINRAGAEMVGWKVEELLGRRLHDIIHHTHSDGSHHPAAECPIYSAFRSGIIHRESDDVFWRKDGTSFPVAYVSTPIVADGKTSGAVVMFRDITARKAYEAALAQQQQQLERLVDERTETLSQEVGERVRTETALRESQNRMQAITGSLFEGVLVVDENGHIVFANPSAENLLFVNGDAKLAGHDLDEVVSLTDGSERLPFHKSPFFDVANTGTIVRDDDATFIARDGKALSVAFACSPLVEKERRRGAIISFRDIRTLKTAQREALQASRLASVGQLAAGIAHEINTPTQYIGDNLRFIADSFGTVSDLVRRYRAALSGTAPQPAAIEDLTGLEAEARRLELDYLMEEIPTATAQSLEGVAHISRIVSAMKEFSHPGGKEKALVDINRAIENTVTVCRNEWKHVAELVLQLDASLPQVSCMVGEINQVLLNLIVNAAHAIEAAGSKHKGVIAVTTVGVGDHVEIRVSDTGIGMDDEIKQKVFDPFFTTKEVGKGTGQGLTICRDVVVAKHGGSIAVDSQPGNGSVFTILLPIEGTKDTAMGCS